MKHHLVQRAIAFLHQWYGNGIKSEIKEILVLPYLQHGYLN